MAEAVTLISTKESSDEFPVHVWAERGRIQMHDTKCNQRTDISVAEMSHRLLAVQAAYLVQPDPSTQKLISVMSQVITEAKNQKTTETRTALVARSENARPEQFGRLPNVLHRT